MCLVGGCPSSPSVPAAIPAVQFAPDPTVGASATVNGGLNLAENNPSPVHLAEQQVTGSIFPCEVVPPQSKNSFLSLAVPLPHRALDKVKKQIWVNEHVDFAILLNNSLTQADEHYMFRVEKGESEKPALTLPLILKVRQCNP